MSIADKKKQTLMRRRKRAIVLSVIAIVILAIALVFVMDYVETLTFEDVDGTEYYIRKKDGVYAMYDAKRAPLPYDTEYESYVTALGTLVSVDPETGEHEIIAIVDTEYSEQYDLAKAKLMMFPKLSSANIMQISVNNADDGYTFARYDLEKNQFSKDASFIIMNSPSTTYDAERFATLYVNTGYTLCTLKLEDPIKDANGEFTEYGLAPQTRLDEDGNAYEYTPSYYVISDTSGNSHKVIIGDMLPTGDGYYAQYVAIDKDGKETKRDAVYVLDKSTGDCVNATVEYYVTPLFCYPMSLTNYFDVENFEVYIRQKNAVPGDSADKLYGDPIVGFTYLDLSNRENTLQANYPYAFTNLKLDGYYPSSQAIIDKCLYGLYSPSIVELHKLAPSVEDFVEFGFYAPVTDEDGNAVLDKDGKQEYSLFADYTFSYDFDVAEGDSSYTVNQKIIVSDERWDEEKGEYVKNGNYYVYCTLLQRNADGSLSATGLYNMIVEVEAHSLDFLTWDRYEWINNSYFQSNIAYVTDLKIESPSYSASFKLDNSASDSSEGTNSNYIKVDASDSNGNKALTFNKMTVTDSDGYIWTITLNEISVANAAGKQMSVAEGTLYYSHNALGRQVRCHSKYIVCKDARVEVTENTVRILYNNGEEETYVRYQTDLFRKFYETLTYSTIVESYAFDPADESALLSDPSAHLLTMTVTTCDVNGEVETTTYSFYQIPGASRKAYITINGNGGFYVMRSRVDKFITDAQKFFALDTSIDYKAKD